MRSLTKYEYDIFLSYDSADQEWTRMLAERLEQEDWQGCKLAVFFSPRNISPGQSILKRIENALSKSRKVGLVMSPDAVESPWVDMETIATIHADVLSGNSRLIPIYRHECDVPPFVTPLLYVDFRNDAEFEESFKALVAAIRDEGSLRTSTGFRRTDSLPALIPRPPLVGFVSRCDREGRDIVQRLREELTVEKNQVVSLWGDGGVGKTTVAGQAVRAVAPGYQRVVWIDALGREDFSLSTLVDQLASQLNEHELIKGESNSKLARLGSVVRAFRTLIVLDNFETIPPSEGVKCLRFLINDLACPTLITSREILPDTYNIPIDSMTAAEAFDFLDRLMIKSKEAISLTDSERSRIIQASQANPQVMQWMVAQIALAQTSEDVLDELARGEGNAVQRVFARSFELPQLGNDGRTALLALSLFSPSASREALSAVAGFAGDRSRLNQAIKALAGLRLLVAQNDRLFLQGLSRSLARARLIKEKSGPTLRRQFVQYVRSYSGSHSQSSVEDFNALEPERENILAALAVAVELKDWDSVMKTRIAVDEFLDRRGYWHEAISSGVEAERAARETHDESAAEMFAVNRAIIEMHLGDYKHARQTFEHALEFYESISDKQNTARILHNLSILAYDRAELRKSENFCGRSLEIKKEIGDENGIANSLYQIGLVAEDRQDLIAAQRAYTDSLRIKSKLGDGWNLAIILHNLAAIARHQRDFSKVRELYLRSMEINEQLGDSVGVAITKHMLGLNAQDHGNLDEARVWLEASLEMSRQLGFLLGIALTLDGLAEISELQGDGGMAGELRAEGAKVRHELAQHRLKTSALLSSTSHTDLWIGRGVAATFYSLSLMAHDRNYQTEAARLLRESSYIFEKAT